MTSFGESHGAAMGVVIDGCPAGVDFDLALLKKNLARRRPGQSSVTTARNEADEPKILSGVYQNQTLGTPICIVVENLDQRSQDYDEVEKQARIGHADDTWKKKFGHVDHRGGGRSSGRETLSRVIAGTVAEMLVKKICPEAKLKSFASVIGPITLPQVEREKIWTLTVDDFVTRFPSPSKEREVVQLLEKAVQSGESYGGIVETEVVGLPAGLGQPVFRKLKSDLATAMMSIGATTAFEFGAGFDATHSRGTEFHQQMHSHVYGGIRGGITTGEPLNFKVGFKPTSSIKDIAKKGRHDPCIVTRAVPVVEAMTWLVIAEHLLWSRLDRV